MSEPTKTRLAKALLDAGLTELSVRAGNGEFSDFESPHATPKMELLNELAKIFRDPKVKVVLGQAASRIGHEVIRGEWDDTKEEAQAWGKSQGL